MYNAPPQRHMWTLHFALIPVQIRQSAPKNNGPADLEKRNLRLILSDGQTDCPIDCVTLEIPNYADIRVPMPSLSP